MVLPSIDMDCWLAKRNGILGGGGIWRSMHNLVGVFEMIAQGWFFRVLSVFAFGGPIVFASWSASADDLDQFGLRTLQAVSDRQGMEIRGASSAAGGGGMSFVSGFLHDSATGSTASLLSVHSSTAFGDQSARHQQQSAIEFGMTINGLSQRLQALAFGGGWFVARP